VGEDIVGEFTNTRYYVQDIVGEFTDTRYVGHDMWVSSLTKGM